MLSWIDRARPPQGALLRVDGELTRIQMATFGPARPKLKRDRVITHVLGTTATLAWGVNLPAHAVVCKGTDVYDPSTPV